MYMDLKIKYKPTNAKCVGASCMQLYACSMCTLYACNMHTVLRVYMNVTQVHGVYHTIVQFAFCTCTWTPICTCSHAIGLLNLIVIRTHGCNNFMVDLISTESTCM